MNMPARIFVNAAMVVASLSFAGAMADELAGELAPDFVLKSGSGENMRLSEYRGEVVLVNFWATWCGECRDQMPSLDSLYGLYRDAGLRLLSINLDSETDRGEELSERLNLGFPVLYDSDREVSRLYDVGSTPVTLLIDREGIVRHVHWGYRRGAEERYLEQVKALLRE